MRTYGGIGVLGVCCCLVRCTASDIVLCYSWTAVDIETFVVEHHPWVSWQQKNSSSQETDMADTERSDKELRDRGIRDIVGGCDAGDANRSVALCAKPGCVERMLPLQAVQVVVVV